MHWGQGLWQTAQLAVPDEEGLLVTNILNAAMHWAPVLCGGLP